jgi:hypothetical protein
MAPSIPVFHFPFRFVIRNDAAASLFPFPRFPVSSVLPLR